MKLVSSDYFRNNVAFRNDTILGVCEALGQDLGINPNLLRVPLATGIIVAPMLMIGIYAAMGVVAFASRTLFPDRVERVERNEQGRPALSADNQQVELPRAA